PEYACRNIPVGVELDVGHLLSEYGCVPIGLPDDYPHVEVVMVVLDAVEMEIRYVDENEFCPEVLGKKTPPFHGELYLLHPYADRHVERLESRVADDTV